MFSFKNTTMNWADERENNSLDENKPENITVTDTDTDDDLKVFHYTLCNDSSSDFLKRHRGIVCDMDNNIVCKTFGYIDEIINLEKDKIKNSIHSFNQCKFFKALEGAYVRLFFYKNKWYLSTHRKLNAFKSKWGSHDSDSFGKMFVDALKWNIDNKVLNLEYEDYDSILDVYTNTLQKDKNYLFLVSNNAKNRIVCYPPKNPTVHFVGSFDKSTHLYIEGNDSGIDSLAKLDFSDLDSLVDYVSNIHYMESPGVIVYMPNQKQVKIINSQYSELFKVRGNEPSIKFRYLQIRKEQDKVELLTRLYPDHNELFLKCEEKIYFLCEKIYKAYVDRYINNKYVSLPQQEYFILQDCHRLYKNSREKISHDTVMRIIDDKKPQLLNRLLKFFKY